MYIKRFAEWIRIKLKLDSNDFTPPLMREGEVWWCAIGENIGVEVCGKGRTFTRPVVILKKFGRMAFFGVPLTTKNRTGSWYMTFAYKGTNQPALLTQTRLFSYKRLGLKIGELDKDDFKKIKEAFLSLFSDNPPCGGRGQSRM